MNREQRRLMEREERRQKKQDERAGGGRQAASQRAAGAMAQRKAEGRLPVWKRLVQFLHDVRVELKKVSWPTRDQMVAFTTVTVITSVALTALTFALDIGLRELVFIAIGGTSG
jgi:preprotein translocase subunit SecE